MSYDLPLDENLRGLLVELAEQPERVMLGTRVRQFSDLLRPDVEVLRPTTGMGVVEAKLIEAYREELASLLLRAAVQRPESSPPQLLASRDQQGRVRAVDRGSIARRAKVLLTSRLAESQPSGAMELLRGAFGEPPQLAPSTSALAIASLRLAPRTETRVWLGVFESTTGNVRRGVELQLRAATETQSRFLAAYAWANASTDFNTLHRFHESMEAARSAVLEDPLSVRASISWLVAALQTGSVSEIAMAASSISKLADPDAEQVEENVQHLRRSRARGQWAPTRSAVDYLRSRTFSLSPAPERIVETFS